MQVLVLILVFTIALPLTVIVGAYSVIRIHARSVPPELTPYEYHRDRYINGGDENELEQMLREMEEK